MAGDVQLDGGDPAPGAQRRQLPAGLADVRPHHDQAVPAPRGAGPPARSSAPRSGAFGPMPASARTNDGPVRNRNDAPARSASSTPQATVSRSEYSVALTTTQPPSRTAASSSRTRSGPPSRMSARLMLATSPRRIAPPLFSATKSRRSDAA